MLNRPVGQRGAVPLHDVVDGLRAGEYDDCAVRDLQREYAPVLSRPLGEAHVSVGLRHEANVAPERYRGRLLEITSSGTQAKSDSLTNTDVWRQGGTDPNSLQMASPSVFSPWSIAGWLHSIRSRVALQGRTVAFRQVAKAD